MTVQNTKLSGYNPNRQPASIPSYLGLPRISSWKKFANLFKPDTPNKLKCDCFCTGRSMVEMLGVLAIVGVLSVGAIAGYSKAMMKYRLNQIINTTNQLLTKTIEINSLNIQGFKTGSNYTKIFVNAGYAPDGFTYSTKTPDYLHDIFGNPIWIFKSNTTGISFGYGITHYKKDTCYAMLNLGKEWKSDLFYVSVDSAADVENNIPQKVYGNFFGDDDCKSGLTCLSDLSLKNIGLVCDNCDKSDCRVYYFTKPVK